MVGKGVKKRLVWIICTAVCFLCGCQVTEGGKLPEGFDEKEVREKAECIVGWFNAQEYDKIIEAGDEDLKKLHSAEDIEKEGKNRLEKCGTFQKIEKTAIVSETDRESGKTYGGLVLIGAYENGKIEFQIFFDEEMRMIQFLIR